MGCSAETGLRPVSAATGDCGPRLLVRLKSVIASTWVGLVSEWKFLGGPLRKIPDLGRLPDLGGDQSPLGLNAAKFGPSVNPQASLNLVVFT